ncbi:MAG: uridine kinase [Candidatus Krumholzibacteria bacterium]|nr:uridine kinase [Candidatus Krumholzibacteria bacterium]
MTAEGKVLVIGISGGSCSGKSSIAARVAEMMKDREAVVLSLDSYYRDLSSLPPAERKKCNFDAPEALDIDLAVGHLRALVAGRDVLVPVYRFEDHTRAPESEWVRLDAAGGGEGKGAVIVEGLFTLHYPQVRSMIDLAIFVDAGHDTCLERRLRRDVAERGRTPTETAEQYEKTVRPMFERFVAAEREFADMTVDGERGAESAAVEILTRLSEMGLR